MHFRPTSRLSEPPFKASEEKSRPIPGQLAFPLPMTGYSEASPDTLTDAEWLSAMIDRHGHAWH